VWDVARADGQTVRQQPIQQLRMGCKVCLMAHAGWHLQHMCGWHVQLSKPLLCPQGYPSVHVVSAALLRMLVPPYIMCHIIVHAALDGAVDAPRQLYWLQLHTHHDVWFLLLPMHLHQTHPQAQCQRWDRSCQSFQRCVASHSGPRLPCGTHGWLPLMPLLQLQ
jgi:hypothetical protein